MLWTSGRLGPISSSGFPVLFRSASQGLRAPMARATLGYTLPTHQAGRTGLPCLLTRQVKSAALSDLRTDNNRSPRMHIVCSHG